MNSTNLSNNKRLKGYQMKLKYKLTEIKSKYIIQKIFDNLKKEKLLDLIKYNKKIKIRMNISIKDYKKYSEIYSSIEIEIIPKIDVHNKFINIKYGEENYYHIYFNNNKKELKRTYIKENEKVETIKIIIAHQVKSFEGLFHWYEIIKSINFKKFHRNNNN